MSRDSSQPRDPRFRQRVPIAERTPGPFDDPKPPAGWQPAPRPAPEPLRPLMPPQEHEVREPRLYAAAKADDVAALAEAANHRWDWHGDELIRAAGAAAEAGAMNALRWLLDHGVAAAARTAKCYNREISVDVGSEPLMNFAAAGGVVEVATFLESRGACVGMSDGSGRTPLHAAAGRGHTEMVRWLLDRGADVNALAFEGTPLALAAWGGHVEAVRALLAAGADPNLKHGCCESAIGQGRRHPAVRAVLEEKGA